MAPNSKKRLVQIPAPSAASSSSEEQQDSSSSSSSEEEQPEHPQPVTLKPHQQQQHEDEDDSAEDDDDEETEESDEPEKPALKNPSLKKPQSESESESKEDEESDSDDDGEAIKSPMVSDFTLKPRVPNSAKRAAENSGSSSKNKKAKVSNGGDGQIVRSADEAKKFSRVWSADDEIKLLEGVIAYKAENGSDSITNLGPFHETVKDLNLSLDVTRTRLYEKLRALKKKYQNNVAKKGDIVFSKPHELKLYKLSEIIWGGEEGGLNEESGSKVKSTPDKKKSNKAANVSVKKSVENKDMVKTDQVSDEIKDDALDVGSLYPRLAASIELEASTHLPVMSVNSKDFAKEMVLKLGKEKAKELEEEWNDYTEMEYRLCAKRLQMIHKHAEMFLDVTKH